MKKHILAVAVVLAVSLSIASAETVKVAVIDYPNFIERRSDGSV
ncbi:MAG: hypothetical protein ACQGQO_11675 [Sphaerochaetaceae bacterium]